ncbi:MAG: heme-binding domain-containing protein [Bacteroidetes bacterium]|nr:heme-binding domain-containing protein [Bacteroidota bacterium]
MRKTSAFLWISFAVVFFLVLAFRPVNASGSVKYAEGNPELPDSVAKIIQKACMDCHGADGNSMAKMRVNFSSWNTYDTKRQADKANDISKKVSKGSMPPGKWRKNNPGNIPTQAEVDLIKNWAKALNN